MGKDSSDIIRYFFLKNTPNIIQMLFPLCKVVFIYSGIVQMCTPCPGTLNRRASTISTPLYTFSLFNPYSKGHICEDPQHCKICKFSKESRKKKFLH